MNNTVIKKSQKGSFFRTVQTASNSYNWESLEIQGYDVLQIMRLNEKFLIVEYGKYEEAED